MCKIPLTRNHWCFDRMGECNNKCLCEHTASLKETSSVHLASHCQMRGCTATLECKKISTTNSVCNLFKAFISSYRHMSAPCHYYLWCFRTHLLHLSMCNRNTMQKKVLLQKTFCCADPFLCAFCITSYAVFRNKAFHC